MNLYKNILLLAIQNGDITLQMNNDINKVIATKEHQALRHIKLALEDKSLSDYECLDQIIYAIEDVGIEIIYRHD